MQWVPHVKKIDNNFQAFFSLSFFLKLIYLIKALILYILILLDNYRLILIKNVIDKPYHIADGQICYEFKMAAFVFKIRS